MKIIMTRASSPERRAFFVALTFVGATKKARRTFGERH
jgi:hypothetical protein